MSFISKIPTFAPGPLRKEILFALRDLTCVEQELRYGEYSDGILSGCRLYESGMRIGVEKGMVKYTGRVYMLREKTSVPYRPTDQWMMLKIRFAPQIAMKEYIFHIGELVLEENVQLMPNELELGRFKLKKGSSLRTEYKDFADLQTGYDTVNLTFVRQAGIGKATLRPEVTHRFAHEAYPLAQDPLDIAFCATALEAAPVPKDYLQHYICRRLGTPYREMAHEELLPGLAQVLQMLYGCTHRPMDKLPGIRLFN